MIRSDYILIWQRVLLWICRARKRYTIILLPKLLTLKLARNWAQETLERFSKVQLYHNSWSIDLQNKTILIGYHLIHLTYVGTWQGTTTVAMKKLKRKDLYEDFLAEAVLLQKLNHANIVRYGSASIRRFTSHLLLLFHVGITIYLIVRWSHSYHRWYGMYTDSEGFQYLVTEYLSGGSLNTLLQEEESKLTILELLHM